MGCASSTEYVVDANGQEKKKKKLGGSYPGQRRPQHQPYAPSAAQFGEDGTATAHFIAHGGGNALTLVRKDGTSQPQAGKPQPQYIQVTLPEGVTAGQTIHVQAPDGAVNAIVVPEGFGAGSSFTVEFAAENPILSSQVEQPVHQVPAPSNNNNNINLPDDGFASGFNNPTWQPAPATAMAYATNEPEVVVSGDSALDTSGAYPTTAARPVYTTGPVYPK